MKIPPEKQLMYKDSPNSTVPVVELNGNETTLRYDNRIYDAYRIFLGDFDETPNIVHKMIEEVLRMKNTIS